MKLLTEAELKRLADAGFPYRLNSQEGQKKAREWLDVMEPPPRPPWYKIPAIMFLAMVMTCWTLLYLPILLFRSLCSLLGK